MTTLSAKNSELTRRSFISSTAKVAAVSWFAPLFCSCQATPVTPASNPHNSDPIDEALERLGRLALWTNHGPMAAEALITLGRAEQVPGWIEAYKRRFTSSYPAPYEAVTRANWQAALGDGRREADWVEFIRRELNEAAWPQVLSQWASTLMPGLSAAAAHGLIRTAHAVRSLHRQGTELRRRELAEGLAYWAARYHQLPDTPIGKPGQLEPAPALVQVPHLPEEKRGRGSIDAGLRSLQQFSEFARVGDLIALSGDPSLLLSKLTETFAAVYVREAQSSNAIALVHAVTGTTALRSLLPHLSSSAARSALRYGWQMGAAIYSVYGQNTINSRPTPTEIKTEDLIDRAVAAGDEHAIKFTEACVREWQLNRKPVYLQAALDAVQRFKLRNNV
ncbi:MAG TPA: questin oxidase family protein [Pyrinomonadaceae bacterium]